MSKSNITWGGVMAGASVAVGALVVGTAFYPEIVAAFAKEGGEAALNETTMLSSIGETLSGAMKDIGTSISSLVSWVNDSLVGEVSAVDLLSKESQQLVQNPMAQKIAGATLLGGGAAYFMGGSSKKPVAEEVLADQKEEGFAIREDIKRNQALMMARMAAQSPQHMQAFMGRA